MNEKAEKKSADVVNAAHYSTGAVAASFTSTSMPVETVHEAAIREEDSVRYERVKKKAYLRIKTNFGPINLELHCDLIPKACENFLLLCRRGYYNGTIFHRSIKHFMIQGGDPTGKGTGGESAWGEAFQDEFKPQLSHTGRGVLSMANSGPDSNKSQFFITYRSCKHLDGKHTIFGRVVGGMETLSAVEAVEVDNKDKPIEDIIFQEAQIFSDPFVEVDEILAKERAEERARLQLDDPQVKKSKPAPAPKLKAFREGVGRYIDPKRKLTANGIEPDSSSVKKKAVSYDFKNFSGW
jgi:peptidyl-prolyl cis-trans isomerase-like protein 2